MHCPGCDTQIHDSAKFCKDCGWKASSGMGVGLIVLIVVLVGGCLVFGFISIVAAIAIPNLIEARKHGNEAAAIGALKTITTAQSLYREADKDGNEIYDYGSLEGLSDTMLIDGILGSGTKQGYVFECEASSQTPEFIWTASASPAVPGTTGDRFFGVSQAGVVYYSKTGPVRFDEEGQVLGDAVSGGR